MVPVQLAKTMEESKLKQIVYLAEAKYWRFVGNEFMEKNAMNKLRDERFNNKYFLGEPPF